MLFSTVLILPDLGKVNVKNYNYTWSEQDIHIKARI